ncbi:MAG: tetratricopeptide repeat protein, partial [Sediminibacterium sp.]|nr:tetratricopeptide repeat protein [Sediminibacterium sp.]
MRRSIILLASLIILQKSSAQYFNPDSVWHIIETTKDKDLRFDMLYKMNLRYQNASLDSNIFFAKKLLEYGEKINDQKIIAYGTLNLGYPFIRTGDLRKGQGYIQKATKIAEQYPDNEVFSRISNFNQNIEVDPQKKLVYIKKAVSYISSVKGADLYKVILFCNASVAFRNIDIDSALFYAQKAGDISLKIGDTLSTAVPFALANTYMKMDQPDLALVYFKRSLANAVKTNLVGDLMRGYGGMAGYFIKMNRKDSALYYQKKIFYNGHKETVGSKVNSAKWQFDFYTEQGNRDSAIKYAKYYITGNDTLNNRNTIADLQQARFEEDLRQHELQIAKEEEQEQRNRDLQLVITAIVILSIITLFLLLSRSILVSHRLVGFLNVVVLLVVFEFIN